MIFHNYTIPKNITAEDIFMYDLVAKMHGAGSHRGFVIGEFYRVIDIMREQNVPEEHIKMLSDLVKMVEQHLDEYQDIRQFAVARWKEIGEPLSLEAHQAKKERLDREDEIKSDYYDR